DGCAAWVAYLVAGVPNPPLGAPITAGLGPSPFWAFVAFPALPFSSATAATASFTLGSLVLFLGDKLVRPAMARNGTHLPYVWILMGCLGGFQVLGLVGLVVGPVALTLSRELLAKA